MNQAFQKYICKTCGLIYDEAEGDPDSGLAPGTRFADIPEDWYCPLCLVSKSDFVLIDESKTATDTNARAKRKVGGKDSIVIIGSGYAGWQAAEAVKQANPNANISLITGCDGSIYPKPAISMALSQGRTAEELKEASADQKAVELGISLKVRIKVMSINARRKKITTTGGSFAYDKLILALGAQSISPNDIEGNALDRIMTINDLTTYKRFRKALEGKQHISIIGGGLIAVEMAEDLASQGIDVDLFVRGERVMRQMLPPAISESLKQKLMEKGVNLRLNSQLTQRDTALNPQEEEQHSDPAKCLLTTQKNDHLITDLVVAAVGLKPNVALAKKAKLDTNQGICINQFCQTSNNDIYAIGDCAETDGVVQAYLEPIRRQAKTIASHIAGKAPIAFKILPPLVKTKTPSLSIMTTPPLKAGNGEWVIKHQDGEHQELVYMDAGKVTGFALSGKEVASANERYQTYFSA